jgi:hypothetical protein
MTSYKRQRQTQRHTVLPSGLYISPSTPRRSLPPSPSALIVPCCTGHDPLSLAGHRSTFVIATARRGADMMMDRHSRDTTPRVYAQPHPIPFSAHHHHRNTNNNAAGGSVLSHSPPPADRGQFPPPPSSQPASSPRHSNPSLSPVSSPTHSVSHSQQSKRRRVPQEERKRTAMSCDRCKSRKIKVPSLQSPG